MLGEDATIGGERIRELIAPLGGFDGGQTIVDDYVREARPLFATPRRISAASIGRARTASSIPWSRPPRCRSVTAGPGAGGSWSRVWAYSRVGAGALVFSAQIPGLAVWDPAQPLGTGPLPETLVGQRKKGLHAGGGPPTVKFAAFGGAHRVDEASSARGTVPTRSAATTRWRAEPALVSGAATMLAGNETLRCRPTTGSSNSVR